MKEGISMFKKFLIIVIILGLFVAMSVQTAAETEKKSIFDKVLEDGVRVNEIKNFLVSAVNFNIVLFLWSQDDVDVDENTKNSYCILAQNAWYALTVEERESALFQFVWPGESFETQEEMTAFIDSWSNITKQDIIDFLD